MSLSVEIISREGIIYNANCQMATVPSVSGEIGVMEGHEAVTASLRQGVVKIYDEKESIIKEFEVDGGTAQVHDNKLIILVD